MNGEVYRAVLNDVLPPPEKLYLQTKISSAFSRILHLLTKRVVARTHPKSYQSGLPLALTSIHWTINFGWCWRNVSVPRGTKIWTHWRLRLQRWWEKFFPGHYSWISRWLAEMFAALCGSKRRTFWVTTFEMCFLKYFLSFLKILYPYL